MVGPITFVNSRDIYKKENMQSRLFTVSAYDILFRIFVSFMPPFNKKYGKIYVDFLGPLIGVTVLTALVTYGNLYKNTQVNVTPVEFVCGYSVFMPIFCFLITRLGCSAITLYETISLIGYSLYGHLLTLLVSFICFQERSNFFFFVCLIFFGGLSTIRIALVLLGTISIPAARLLICTTISVINMLCLIFLHFGFMHRTFVFKNT